MLNRRSFVSFLSTLPILGFKKSEGSTYEGKVPFIPKEALFDSYLKIFPEGLYLTKENIQKLLDNGFMVSELNFPITGKFTINGAILHYKNSKFHREDGPAVVHADGSQYWYLNGELHREDGPAFISSIGDQMWFKNGKRHRENGPAIVHPSGTQYWYKNGEVHREDGPAVILANGEKYWWINGIHCHKDFEYIATRIFNNNHATDSRFN